MSIQTTNLNDQLRELVVKVYPSEVIEVIAESIIEANPDVRGLAIGATAPNFVLKNTKGEDVVLYEILKNNGVVLSFFRGDWCPFCNLEVKALQQALPKIEALGAVVLTVHPQRINTSLKLQHNHSITYQILNDPTQDVLALYNVKFKIPDNIQRVHLECYDLDVSKMNENGELTLPVPATFIIDKNAVIRSRFFSHDYTTRMETKDILRALENMPDFTASPVYEGILERLSSLV